MRALPQTQRRLQQFPVALFVQRIRGRDSIEKLEPPAFGVHGEGDVVDVVETVNVLQPDLLTGPEVKRGFAREPSRWLPAGTVVRLAHIYTPSRGPGRLLRRAGSPKLEYGRYTVPMRLLLLDTLSFVHIRPHINMS